MDFLNNSWPRVSIGDVCQVVSGSTPRTDNPEYWDGDILWATPRDLRHLDSPFLYNTAQRITYAGYRSCSTTLLPRGSVLFTSRAPVGLVAIAGEPMCTNQGFKSLIPGPSIDSRYLYWCLRHYGSAIESRGSGTTFTEVSRAVVARFEIPLPPVENQRRIAATLEKAQEIQSKHRQTVKLAEDFLQSVFGDWFGDPFTNRKGWQKRRLGDLAVIRRGASPRPINEYLGGRIPWVKIGDATHRGGLFVNQTAECITEAGAARSVQLDAGSIIIANSGVSLGFARILGVSACIHDGWLSAESLNDDVDRIFFVSFINSITTHLRSLAPTGTQPNLNTSIARAILVPIPPREMQLRFADLARSISVIEAKMRVGLVESADFVNAFTRRVFTAS